ncbi:hypothetical protein SOTOND1_00563 [Chlamydia trachomatis D/SotonD1]|nr:hypothetical protein SOTOND1_00563 [Chlamydia trachomatis D/SotonD1]CPS22424.1 Uncharacterised protein [Chlamydia trachomatis]
MCAEEPAPPACSKIFAVNSAADLATLTVLSIPFVLFTTLAILLLGCVKKAFRAFPVPDPKRPHIEAIFTYLLQNYVHTKFRETLYHFYYLNRKRKTQQTLLERPLRPRIKNILTI